MAAILVYAKRRAAAQVRADARAGREKAVTPVSCAQGVVEYATELGRHSGAGLRTHPETEPLATVAEEASPLAESQPERKSARGPGGAYEPLE
jgi:hypothetical protein